MCMSRLGDPGLRRVLCEVTLLLLVLPAAAARADLHFEQPVANLGEVRGGTPLTHRFTFVNEGPAAVDITNAQASCGCVTPRVEKNSLQPGESGALLLEVHTLNQPAGPRKWTVRLSYRGGAPALRDDLAALGPDRHGDHRAARRPDGVRRQRCRP